MYDETLQQPVSPSEAKNATLNGKPSFINSMALNLTEGYYAATLGPLEALENHISTKLGHKQGPLPGQMLLDMTNEANNNPNLGIGQQGADWVANMVGMGLSPLTWLGGEAGAAVGAKIGALGARLTPSIAEEALQKPLSSIIGKGLPNFVGKESIASLGKKGVIGFGTVAGAMAPTAVTDNYDKNTGNIFWGGTAKEMVKNGAFGVALGVIPYTAGVVLGKARLLFKDEKMPVAGSKASMAHYDELLDKNIISKEEHQWVSDYLNDPKAMHLNEKAVQILTKDGGHDIDPIHYHANFEVLGKDDIDNIKSAFMDKVASDLPDEYRDMMHEFTVHNGFDKMRDRLKENPSIANGIKGFVEYLQDKLERQNEEIKKTSDMVHRHFKENIPKRDELSQTEIYRALKRGEEIPHTIPGEVIARIRQEDRLKDLSTKIRKLESRLKKGEVKYQAQFDRMMFEKQTLENKIKKFESPESEIKKIKDSLIKDGKLKPDFKLTREYNRLAELSTRDKMAKGLMLQLHEMHEYNRQDGFKNMLDVLMKINDADVNKFANMENPASYLKARIDAKLASEVKADVKETIKQAQQMDKVPANLDERINEQKESMREDYNTEDKKEFKEIQQKMNNFRKGESVFKELMNCVRGKL